MGRMSMSKKNEVKIPSIIQRAHASVAGFITSLPLLRSMYRRNTQSSKVANAAILPPKTSDAISIGCDACERNKTTSAEPVPLTRSLIRVTAFSFSKVLIKRLDQREALTAGGIFISSIDRLK